MQLNELYRDWRKKRNKCTCGTFVTITAQKWNKLFCWHRLSSVLWLAGRLSVCLSDWLVSWVETMMKWMMNEEQNQSKHRISIMKGFKIYIDPFIAVTFVRSLVSYETQQVAMLVWAQHRSCHETQATMRQIVNWKSFEAYWNLTWERQ